MGRADCRMFSNHGKDSPEAHRPEYNSREQSERVRPSGRRPFPTTGFRIIRSRLRRNSTLGRARDASDHTGTVTADPPRHGSRRRPSPQEPKTYSAMVWAILEGLFRLLLKIRL